MDNTKLINKLRGKGFDELRDALKNILLVYCTPSFGSMTKHDIDLLMFDVMISLGIVDSSPSIYDVMRELKVTRSKARNLIYEHQLRSVENDNQLLAELREVLKCPLLSRKSDNVCLEIDNPYLMDFIRNELKKLGHITDGSFNSEMVKMSTSAFSDLYYNCMEEANKTELKRRMVELGVAEDTSLKAILPHLFKGVATTVAKGAFGKVGEDITDNCVDFLHDVIEEHGADIKTFFGIT